MEKTKKIEDIDITELRPDDQKQIMAVLAQLEKAGLVEIDLTLQGGAVVKIKTVPNRNPKGVEEVTSQITLIVGCVIFGAVLSALILNLSELVALFG